MYPTAIQKQPFWANISYRVSVPVVLLLWLLPLLAIMLTSIRSIEDITAGNYWGWPTTISLKENYWQVFTTTPMGKYLLNSLAITIPTVIGAVGLATMSGFALAKYQFKANLWLFATFIAGNFVPFQILMIPVRDLTIQLDLYDTTMGLVLFHIAFQTGFCTLFMRSSGVKFDKRNKDAFH